MKGSIILWSCVIVFGGLVIALLFLQRYFLIEYLESTVRVLSADKEAYVFVGQGKAITRATQFRAMLQHWLQSLEKPEFERNDLIVMHLKPGATEKWQLTNFGFGGAPFHIRALSIGQEA
jgi:hypothetical protein